MLHSKSTYFYRWGSRKKLSSLAYLIPSVCILALLVGTSVAVNPIVNGEKVYAGEGSTGHGSGTTDTTPSISLVIEGDATQTTSVTAGEVAYRTNIFKVTANYYRDFTVSLSSMNGYGSELHGRDNPAATIGGVGENVAPNNFSDNTWGYAVTGNLNTDSEKTLNYNTVPAYSEGAKAISTYNYQEESEWNVAKNYKLVFAAKIGINSPVDHYTSQVALSVVGTPGEIASLGEISTMQEMTASVCDSLELGATGQLKDVRDGKYYWK